MTNPIIQIAGIIDWQEADLVMASGATHLGFPLQLDVNKEDITEEQASKIIHSLPSPEMGVLITYLDKSDEIVELVQYLGCGIIQLHGPIEDLQINVIKQKLPGINIWKSLVVSEDNFDSLKTDLGNFEPLVDAFITDTYDPETGASGATGKVHNWEVSRELVKISNTPIILAGGLNPENVYKAIQIVKPAGVDTHTGLEDSEGRKNPEKCRKFVEEAMRGFGIIHQKIPQMRV